MASEIKVTNIKANDGTASLTIANSTGNMTNAGTLTSTGAITTSEDISTSTTGKVKQKGAFMQSSTHQALALGY